MKKIIAIPVDDNGKLDAHFGHCKFFELFIIENNLVVEKLKLQPPPHEPGVLPKWLSNNGTTDIIAGGMGQKAISLFHNNNIRVCVGAPQIQAPDLINKYLNNELTLTNNYCDH
ncbi:NifB/NifX family molybdenum-iron cluster-binding protein [Marinilabiliaceae bacterium ANBcel2]|nr:NifB/NifX family molybdenum-iron cluster-binding protein [Marinilabiliaceae bacterium ANBcel2]